MITVITRLYSDAASAKGVVGRFYREGFKRNAITLVTPDTRDRERRILNALVPEEAAKALNAAIQTGASLVVVRAAYQPLNAVRIANATFTTSGAIPSGLESESFRVKAPRDHAPSILKDHPRFLTMEENIHGGQTISERLGFRLLSPATRRSSAISGGRRFFGDGVIRGRAAKANLRTGRYMSQAFWPMPLLIQRREKRSVLPDGGHPFSRMFGLPTVSRD